MLEGEYTAWNLVWTQDFGAGVTLNGVLVDNFGTVYTNDSIAGSGHVITYAGVLTNTAAYLHYVFRGAVQPVGWSATHKYVIAENTAVFNQIDIWRDGVLIASIDLFTDNPDNALLVYSWMSPNGKFLAFVVQSVATGNSRYVMLYEGT